MQRQVRKRRRSLALPVLLAGAVGTGLAVEATRAQVPSRTSAIEHVSASSGMETTLDSYAIVRKDACLAGPAPRIRIPQQSFHGVLVVKKGTMTFHRLRGCRAIAAPARIVTFRAQPGFLGTDTISFDVINPVTHQAHTHVFRISVGLVT